MQRFFASLDPPNFVIPNEVRDLHFAADLINSMRLEDVASECWTPSIKQSRGLVSHYGSSPSSSARLLGLFFACYNNYDRWRTNW
jgi:hypothetical protein